MSPWFQATRAELLAKPFGKAVADGAGCMRLRSREHCQFRDHMNNFRDD
jgi:hypothetical protein